MLVCAVWLLVRVMTPERMAARGAELSSDGQMIVRYERFARAQNLATPSRILWNWDPRRLNRPINYSQISNDGNTVAFALSFDTDVYFVDIHTGKLRQKVELAGTGVLDVQWLNANECLAVLGTGVVTKLSVLSKEPIQTWTIPDPGDSRSNWQSSFYIQGAINSDGSRVAIADIQHSRVTIFRLADSQVQQRVADYAERHPTAIAWDGPDRLLVGLQDQSVEEVFLGDSETAAKHVSFAGKLPGTPSQMDVQGDTLVCTGTLSQEVTILPRGKSPRSYSLDAIVKSARLGSGGTMVVFMASGVRVAKIDPTGEKPLEWIATDKLR